MNSSTRNQLHGVVKNLSTFSGQSYIEIECFDQLTIHAQISEFAQNRLKLQPEKQVIALIKAPSISIMTDIEPLKVSAENQINGIISKIEMGTVNTIVTLRVNEKISLSATISLYSGEQLALKVGQNVTAIFNANQVLIATLTL